MAGNCTEEYDVGGSSSPTEGMSAGQRCQSIDSLAEWRSSEQVENGIPSTSPPFWDTDDDDECGPKPSELYGKFTWKIENFRQINKRELRSNAFEVGGYKWYILIYPQGCDVCNHLSLFLCVANHDKLLPGWSHFAQFTIAVVNKDPKKSKFSDTLHRFWKKEHDWGWKKFMENSKVYESFVNDDTLVIKAQVQVIREKANRPFRCLDCQYRRELIRVYLSNVEQICRRFIEDRKNKLSKLIEDKMRWSSFRSFWTGIDQISRRRMSREKSDTILRVVVKQFFVEKEVTSTLVMDSLHSGLKALEHQSKHIKGRLKTEMEDSSDPIVRVEKDMFVLGDDVVLLLDRVASEPLPSTSLPPKDDKASVNRAKEGSCCEEFNKESFERDERRLTELGQRTVEICAVAHIFSRIEVAYQEAIALKRQEELIREEEAAGQAEHELKTKRAAADKEKRAKKKQAKQKKNNRRSKDQGRNTKSDLSLKKSQREFTLDDIMSVEFCSEFEQIIMAGWDTPQDVSGLSYPREVVETLHPDLDDRDSSPVNWDTDASEAHPCVETRSSNSKEQPEKANPAIDDTSSTCSTDSVPSVVSHGPCKGFSDINTKSQSSPNRGRNQLGKELLSQESIAGHFDDALGSSSCCAMEAGATHLKHSEHWPEKHVIAKNGEAATVEKKTLAKDQGDAKMASSSTVEATSSSSHSGRKTPPPSHQQKKSVENNALSKSVQNNAISKSVENAATSSSTTTASAPEPVLTKSAPATNPILTGKPAARALKLPQSSTTKSEGRSIAASNIAKNTSQPSSAAISRPSSAPLIPAAPRPMKPIVSKLQKVPQLPRSASAAGRLGIDPSPSTPSCVPQSYRNAIIGKTTMGSGTTGLSHTSTTQSSTSIPSTSIPLPPPGARKEHDMNFRPSFTFGSVKPDTLPGGYVRGEGSSHQAGAVSNLVNGVERLKIHTDQLRCGQSNGSVVDDFPHLDIINDLLDEEQSTPTTTSSSNLYYPQHYLHPSFNRQYSFPRHMPAPDPGLLNNAAGRYDRAEQYYDDVFHSMYPPMDLSASYAIRQMDGMVQVQWPPYGHSDVLGTDAYSYQFSNYTNLGRGANGYGMYRP